jgi:5'-nucleotidase
MNILVSNDDGIFAQGIRTLAGTLAAAGHRVTVVSPDRERSATGHGLTMHKPIRAEEIESVFPVGVNAWSCSGTPADCVKLALGALMDGPPEIVIAGINHGANLGTDVLYSGTVSAAMEGVMEGIPGIAVSLTSYTQHTFVPAAEFICDLVTSKLVGVMAEPLWLNVPLLLNVNVPALTTDQLKGAKVTRQGIRRYFDQFEKRVDPRGKTYYWLAGEVLEESEDPIANQDWPSSVRQTLVDFPTDIAAVSAGYISITPLQYNLTSVNGLAQVTHWFENGVNPLADQHRA